MLSATAGRRPFQVYTRTLEGTANGGSAGYRVVCMVQIEGPDYGIIQRRMGSGCGRRLFLVLMMHVLVDILLHFTGIKVRFRGVSALRIRIVSRPGGAPKRRRYSWLNREPLV
jgi:hypothetical protein